MLLDHLRDLSLPKKGNVRLIDGSIQYKMLSGEIENRSQMLPHDSFCGGCVIIFFGGERGGGLGYPRVPYSTKFISLHWLHSAENETTKGGRVRDPASRLEIHVCQYHLFIDNVL